MSLALEHIRSVYPHVPPTAVIQVDTLGIVNQTYFLGNAGVLTVYRNRTAEQVAEIARAACQSAGAPFPYPIPTCDGQYSCNIEGRPAILWNRIAGRHYVTHDHSQKEALPTKGHENIVTAFWKIHDSLRTVDHSEASFRTADYMTGQNEYQDVRVEDLPHYLQIDLVRDALN